MITIQGTATDSRSGSPLAGVTVSLKVKEVSGGTFSNSFTTISSTTTSSSGAYSFTFENRTAAEYKLVTTKSLYFSKEQVKNPDHLSTSNPNTWNAVMDPQAWYNINIVNASPYDSFDEIIYQHTEGTTNCAGCCSPNAITYTGMAVNETIDCMLIGDTWLKFQWLVTKASGSVLFMDSVYCTSGDTTYYSLNY